MNNDQPLDITDFLKLILETLEASGVEYLIGGAIAEWAWGEPRATQDLDNVGLTQNKNSNTIYDALEDIVAYIGVVYASFVRLA